MYFNLRFPFAVLLCSFPVAFSGFTHPGILRTTADLNRMKDLIASEAAPWKTAYTRFAADSHSSASYILQGPTEVVTRDKNPSPIKGMYEFASDSVAAMQLS